MKGGCNVLIQKVEKKKYKSSKTFVKQMKQLTKRLAAFEKRKMPVPNDVRKYQALIKQFNEENNIKGDVLNPNIWYTKEQQKEIRDIIKSVYEENKTSTRYWGRIFKEMKEGDLPENAPIKKLENNYDIETVDQLIRTIDALDRSKSSALMSLLLSSDELAELAAYADEAEFEDSSGVHHLNMDIDSLESLLYEEYKDSKGKTGESLYKLVYQIIEDYEKFGIKPEERERIVMP